MSDDRRCQAMALVECVLRGDFEGADRMIAEGESILDAQELIGQQTPLHYVAIEQNVEGVRYLLDRGADPNVGDEAGNTPLSDVVILGHAELVRVLLESAADAFVVSRIHGTLCHAAISHEVDPVILDMLLEWRVDPYSDTDSYGPVFDCLPLDCARVSAYLGVMQKHGLDLASSEEASRALYMAECAGHNGLADALIEAGVTRLDWPIPPV